MTKLQKLTICCLPLLLGCSLSFAQKVRSDSSSVKEQKNTTQLEEVVVIGKVKNGNLKPLSTLDSYLEQADNISMLRRGAYAWEPLLNGMGSERSVITIDGMRIYSACTDKMDPVTSYLEISNLSRARISNGQTGNVHGAVIAGSIDLERRKSRFNNAGLNATAFSGFESANAQRIAGVAIHHSGERFFADVDFTFRDADNYRAGGGHKILYSQFTKYNLSAIAGFKLKNNQQIETSLILDRATDVGYPALPMDVKKAEALISSIMYSWTPAAAFFNKWESKLYYNQVDHVMDDSKRPDVPVRMDMPGWNRTSGMYSMLQGNKGNHEWTANLSAHYNRSYAEMTMYANDPAQKDMFMLTWPDVSTSFANIFLSDRIALGAHVALTTSAGLALQHNNVRDEMGLNSLQIFYPGLEAGKYRWLPNASAGLIFHQENWMHTFSAAYATRAPSVSEAYGFYLFNSADRFDYIGNPLQKNESSMELSTASTWSMEKLTLKFRGSFFHIRNYIIGKPDPALSAMTIGANGIKVYQQLPYANMLNLGVSAEYLLTREINFSGKLAYGYGRTNQGEVLPLIRPLEFDATLSYHKDTFSVETSLNGAARKSSYGVTFGELPLGSYAVIGMATSKSIKINSSGLTVKAGIENILDKYYTTFADWNRFPRMGRNFFVNLIYQIK